jgi:hypothetical protein
LVPRADVYAAPDAVTLQGVAIAVCTLTAEGGLPEGLFCASSGRLRSLRRRPG